MPLDAATAQHPVLRDEKVVVAVNKYFDNKARADALEADNKTLKAAILKAMGTRPVASVGRHVVRVTETAGTQSTANLTITAKMIGQVIPGKKGRAGSTKLEVI
jgi:hypothetical protein